MVQRKISRRALFARDGWRCVYCGTRERPADARPRDPALEGRRLGVGERRHLLRAVQPAQGQPPAARGAHGAPRAPRPPAPVLFIRLATPKIPQRWEQYLGAVRRPRPRPLSESLLRLFSRREPWCVAAARAPAQPPTARAPCGRATRRRAPRPGRRAMTMGMHRSRAASAVTATSTRCGAKRFTSGRTLDRQLRMLLPLRPRAGVEPALAAGEVEAVERARRR